MVKFATRMFVNYFQKDFEKQYGSEKTFFW